MRMALRRSGRRDLTFVEFACDDGAFPSVAAVHAPAGRLERAACDLFGFTRDRCAGRAALARSWPLAIAPSARATASPHDGAPDAYAFLEAEGAGLHQIPVGPVHAGIIEPGHFRFHAGGEAVVRLEERLGYVHKGVDSLMRGASLERARRPGGARQRRLDGRLQRRLRPRRRGGARDRGAGARARAARPDGGARAARQSFRRHRRHLQRRRLLVDARPLRHLARADVARGQGRLRPSADDGRGRSGRRRRRSDSGGGGGDPRPRPRRSHDVLQASSSSTTIPPRCRTARSRPAC